MSIPLFPSLRPSIMSPFWGELDAPIDEEAEIMELEREHREWKASLGQMFGNPLPIGKTSHDPEEDDLEGLADEEDDTSSSDDMDDMPPQGMFRIHDNLSPPPPTMSPSPSPSPATAAPDQPASPNYSPVSEDTSTSTSSSSESTVTVTLNRIDGAPPVEAAGAPARVVVGRHVPAPRPGEPPQPPRFAFAASAGQRVFGGRGAVSPASRAAIDAALVSPAGRPNLDLPDDDSDDDDDDDAPDRACACAATTTPQPPRGGRSAGPWGAPRSIPGPVSEFHRMIASGQIHPSASSSQIDSLIGSMYQAQRAHAARAADEEVDRIPDPAEARCVDEAVPAQGAEPSEGAEP